MGMSEKLGPVQYEGNHAMMAGQMPPEKSYSAQTAQLIDDEVDDFLMKHVIRQLILSTKTVILIN